MRGWGAVRKRRNGWQVDILIAGRRFQKSYPNKTLALDVLKALRKRKAAGGAGAPAAGTTTYADAIDGLRKAYQGAGYTAATLAGYLQDLKAVESWWGPKRIAQTRRSDVDAWVAALTAAKLSPSSIRHRMDRLSQVWDWCIEERLLTERPCELRRPPLRAVREQHAVTEDELRKMLEAATDPRARAALLLAADAGLRRHEVIALELADVDLEKGVLRILGKGGKLRAVPILTDRLRKALEDLEERSPLIGVKDRFALNTLCSSAWSAARPGNPRFHELRRRFATALLDVPGVAADWVRELMGHTSLVVTDRYNKARPAAPPAAVSAALEGGERDRTVTTETAGA